MLNQKMIRKLTNAAVFNRGIDLHYLNKVRSFSVEKDKDGNIVIMGSVKGSGNKIYGVEIVYDPLFDEVIESFCECPAYYSYSGICKHCVAVLLEFLEYQPEQSAILDYMEQDGGEQYLSDDTRRGKGGKLYPSFREKERPRETTPLVKELLQRQTDKATLPLLKDNIYGNVELEPFLECTSEYIAVEFKVGAGKNKYVLKDVFEFVKNVEKGQTYSYGKKLEFQHLMEAFEPVAQRLVTFLRTWVRENGSRYAQYSYGRYGYGGYGYETYYSKLRRISLSGSELEEFLDAARGRPITANVNMTGERLWEQTDEPPVREMTITGQKGGVEVEVRPLFGYYGARNILTFKDGLIYREKIEDMVGIGDFMDCMTQIPEKKFYVEKKDVPAFCRELLPALEKHYQCEKKNFNEADYGVEPVSFEIYLDAPQKDFVTCKVYALYGEKKYEVYGKGGADIGRDTVREAQAASLVSSYCNAFDEQEKAMVISGDEDKLYELLTEGIPRFQQLGEVYVSDVLKKIHVTSSGRVEVGVSLSGNLLELTMEADQMSREELMEILSKYDRKKKYFRLKSGDFINMEGEGIQTLLELKQNLNLTDSQLKKGNLTVPKYRALYLDGELKERRSLSVEKGGTFRALVRDMKTAEENDFEIPASLEDILRKYQRTGFLWLKTLCHSGFGGILADDMGLGKTVQVIAFLLSEFLEAKAEDNRKCLIVTPASLVFNWNSEFMRFAPSIPVKMVTGAAPERREIIRSAQSRDVLITSYELLKRDLAEYEDSRFFCQIIDEAQYIKNHNTQSSRAVKAIEADCRFALTGTPIENRLSELWSIFDYLMPGFLYGYQRFRAEIEVPVVQNQDERAMSRLQKMARPFILRRLKKDVLTDLPDKLEECVYASMEGEQRKLYSAHVQRIQMMLDKQSEEEFKSAKIQILSELTKLRQLCCDPALIYENYASPSAKTAMCLDLIKNAIEGGHKVLLFSQFTSMLANLQEKLREEHISYYTLTGSTPKEKRLSMVESFNGDETSVFCISLKAGGTGLNLTSADIVIHYDPWWNLAVQNQATDRAHRIGQKNTVSVYKLIMKDTIEENIVKLQDRKKELAEQVLSGENVGNGSFTREELMELLQG
ncbi:MAG: DEAD/DEAH box helicase [Clostridium sp.]|nr:DEAD/DEAH box helicase [Clostridium sp.]